MLFCKTLAPGILLSAVCLLAACSQQEEADQVSYSLLGVVPATPQRPGDPQKGYQALVNKPYISCGVPYSAYARNVSPSAPDHLLPGRKGRNAELPYNLSSYVGRDGVELVVSNCLSCHAGFFNGKLVIGLGNEHLDFTGDPAVNAESVGAYVEGEKEAAQWRRWADITRVIGPYMITDTVGVNPAITITLALTAHRDPKTLAWSKEALIEPPPKTPAPVSVPPWWRMSKKHALFYNTEGRGDHARIMMLGAILCADDLKTVKEIDTYAPDIRAYLASLRPPVFPFDIDRKLVVMGQPVFEKNCSGCHGTYGENWTYPNLVIGTDQVGTDPILAQFSTDGRSDRFIRWFNRSFYGEMARAAPAPGYIAPPLDGVWATAPYLHNGSVPTLAALLDSGKRPKYWTRSFSADDYNPQTLGWNYTELAYGKGGVSDPKQRVRIYDTTLPGYSNIGHSFGDSLTDDERKGLLEYLKTL
jgi:mono/diheme cytochrome c family protein